MTPNENQTETLLLHDVSISNLLDGSLCKYLIKFPSIGGINDTIELKVNSFARVQIYASVANKYSSFKKSNENPLEKG